MEDSGYYPDAVLSFFEHEKHYVAILAIVHRNLGFQKYIRDAVVSTIVRCQTTEFVSIQLNSPPLVLASSSLLALSWSLLRTPSK